MGEERVEVGLALEVQEMSIVGVIDVCEDAQELSVNVLCGSREGLGERSAAVGRENVLVVQQVLNPREDIVDVCRGGKFDLLSIRVDPRVFEPAGCLDEPNERG